MATEPLTTPAAALRERLLRGRTEAEIAAGYTTSPLAYVARERVRLRTCSRGCHTLPENAKFDPHTGESLMRGAEPRRPRKLVLRPV